MDLTSIIEKVITEHGSAAIMRDHLALFRDRAKIIEGDNARLEKRVAELEQLTANLAAQLAAAKKKNDELTKPERRTTLGELLVDGILWAYTGDDDTHEWLRFDAMCPHCRTRLCVTDVSGPFALEPGDYRVRYHCDYDGCGKLDVAFRGRASDIEEKAARHILRRHEEKPA
jgi:hypothetical protein